MSGTCSQSRGGPFIAPLMAPRQLCALQPARPAQRPSPLPVLCSPGCLSQHSLPLDHGNPSSFLLPQWAGR